MPFLFSPTRHSEFISGSPTNKEMPKQVRHDDTCNSGKIFNQTWVYNSFKYLKFNSLVLQSKLNIKPFLIMKKFYAQLMLLLCFCMKPYGQPANNLKRMDSLEKRMVQVQDTAKVHILNELSQYYLEFNTEKALRTAQTAFDLAQRLAYPKGMLYSLTKMGDAYRMLEKTDEALSCYIRALNLSVKTENPTEQAQALKNIGFAYFIASDYARALNYSKKALRLASGLHNKSLMAAAMNTMGLVYYEQSIYPKALGYFLNIARLAEQTGDKNLLLRSKMGIGYIYNQVEEYDKALPYFLEAFRLKKQLSPSPSIGILYNLGSVYYGKGDYKKALSFYQTAYQNSLKLKSPISISSTCIGVGATWFQLKNYPKALEFYSRALQNTSSPKLKSMAQVGMSDSYRELGNYKKALGYAQKTLQTAVPIRAQRQIQKAYFVLSKTYEAKGNTNKAYQYHLKYTGLKDSLFSNQTKYRIAILQNNFELEKKQAAIKSLTKIKALQEETINWKNWIIYGLIGVGVIVLRLLIYAWIQNRRKKKALAALEERNLEISRINDELKETQAKLQLALSSGLVGTWSYNIETQKIILDENAARMFGIKVNAEGLSSDDFTKRIFKEDRKREEDLRNNVILYKGKYELEYRVKNRQGKITWIFARGKIEHTPDGKLKYFSGVMVDITEKKELERHKDEFLSIASHELRTPLSSVKGYLQLAQHTMKQDDTAYNFVVKSVKQVLRLERLTSDLTDATRITKGDLHYVITEFDFGTVLKEVVENIQLTAANHRIIIKETVSIKYIADRHRIEQVISNFLNNAIKYSPNANTVLVMLTIEKNEIVVSIQDFGIGIEKQHLYRLHERFYRISSSLKKFEGLGLGLHISSEILKHHKGRFWVTSEAGKGSIFYFTLPLINPRYNEADLTTQNTAGNINA